MGGRQNVEFGNYRSTANYNAPSGGGSANERLVGKIGNRDQFTSEDAILLVGNLVVYVGGLTYWG